MPYIIFGYYTEGDPFLNSGRIRSGSIQEENMNRQVRELRKALYERLNKAVDELAAEKGVTREEILEHAVDFLRIKKPTIKKI